MAKKSHLNFTSSPYNFLTKLNKKSLNIHLNRSKYLPKLMRLTVNKHQQNMSIEVLSSYFF